MDKSKVAQFLAHPVDWHQYQTMLVSSGSTVLRAA